MSQQIEIITSNPVQKEVTKTQSWKKEYLGYVPWSIRYGPNTEVGKCPVRYPPKDMTPISSVILDIQESENIPSVTHYTKQFHVTKGNFITDPRTTDIMIYDASLPDSIDQWIYVFAHLFGQPKFEIDEYETEITNELPAYTPKKIQDTALIEDALRICNSFFTGWDEYVMDRTEEREKLNYIREDNIDKFLTSSVPLIAYDAYDTINLLISVEGIPKSEFGNYKQLYNDSIKETNKKERVKFVRSLVKILSSKVPATTKIKRPMNMSPVINAKASSSADMASYQSTSGA